MPVQFTRAVLTTVVADADAPTRYPGGDAAAFADLETRIGNQIAARGWTRVGEFRHAQRRTTQVGQYEAYVLDLDGGSPTATRYWVGCAISKDIP